MAVVIVFVALAGMAVGSFLNVVAYRLPRWESLVHPGSHCPGCAVAIKPYDNVPVLGWVALRGRCRSCATAISPRYPLVEGVCGVLFAVVTIAKWEHPAQAALGLALVTLLVPVTLIDLDHRLIPNRLTVPFAALALLLGALLDPSFLPEQLIAGAAAFLFFLVAALVSPRGMGMGDVKLAGVLGLYLGRAVGPAVLVALLAGVVIGAGVMARKGVAQGRKTAVPFGPFLAFGALVALFAGDALVDAYTDRF